MRSYFSKETIDKIKEGFVLNSDILGNLKEWGKVLELLDSLKQSKKLDEHQTGLARILKYGENWRLLEKVLECGKEINQPEDKFLLEVFNIITDRNIYLDARILALNTLVCLSPRINHKNNQKVSQALVVRKTRNILNLPGPPIFHEAIAKSLEAMTGSQQVEILKSSKRTQRNSIWKG
jgi:hypothetical protein